MGKEAVHANKSHPPHLVVGGMTFLKIYMLFVRI